MNEWTNEEKCSQKKKKKRLIGREKVPHRQWAMNKFVDGVTKCAFDDMHHPRRRPINKMCSKKHTHARPFPLLPTLSPSSVRCNSCFLFFFWILSFNFYLYNFTRDLLQVKNDFERNKSVWMCERMSERIAFLFHSIFCNFFLFLIIPHVLRIDIHLFKVPAAGRSASMCDDITSPCENISTNERTDERKC